VVTFYGKAVDNEGYVKETAQQTFDLLQPNQPYADLLVVFDNIQNENFYFEVLDSLGYVYEVWDVDDHGGIDNSVTGFGWSTIFGAGWGFDIIPTRGYEGDPFAEFLNSGTTAEPKNFAVASMDYFYANGEPEAPVFEAGDFAYDYFSIGEGVNDPGENLDSLLLGSGDDPVSAGFEENPLVLNATLSGIANWIDWTTAAGEGKDIFYAYNQGFGAGVLYDAGTFKTVMLPWMMAWVVDSVLVDTTWTWQTGHQAYHLMQNILTWFDTDSGVPSSVDRHYAKMVDVYKLHQNYPNPFNPETRIVYEMPKHGRVELTVYNAIGQKVRTLINKRQVAGYHTEVWDGRDERGVPVPSGVYFYKVKMADYTKTLKMALMR